MAQQAGINDKKCFEVICAALDGLGWHYNKNEEDLKVDMGVQGEDLPFSLSFYVRPEISTVYVKAYMFNVEENRELAAVALAITNYRILDGIFDIDMSDGETFYRTSVSYEGTIIDKSTVEYLVHVACSTVDKYNDKLAECVIKRTMSIAQYRDFVNG